MNLELGLSELGIKDDMVSFTQAVFILTFSYLTLKKLDVLNETDSMSLYNVAGTWLYKIRIGRSIRNVFMLLYIHNTINFVCLQRAHEMVKFMLRHGNDLLAMDSIRECDVSHQPFQA